jgi:hypothetical protein
MKQIPDSALERQSPRVQIKHRSLALLACLLPLALLLAAGCDNNPYPPEEAHRPILYRALIEDPKRLDPSISYTVDESEILSLVCNSYFQYDYLKQSPFVLELGIGAVMPTRTAAPAWVMEKGKKVPKTGELWSFRLKPG